MWETTRSSSARRPPTRRCPQWSGSAGENVSQLIRAQDIGEGKREEGDDYWDIQFYSSETP